MGLNHIDMQHFIDWDMVLCNGLNRVCIYIYILWILALVYNLLSFECDGWHDLDCEYVE